MRLYSFDIFYPSEAFGGERLDYLLLKSLNLSRGEGTINNKEDVKSFHIDRE